MGRPKVPSLPMYSYLVQFNRLVHNFQKKRLKTIGGEGRGRGKDTKNRSKGKASIYFPPNVPYDVPSYFCGIACFQFPFFQIQNA